MVRYNLTDEEVDLILKLLGGTVRKEKLVLSKAEQKTADVLYRKIWER